MSWKKARRYHSPAYWVDRLFSWRNPRLFRLRIWLRIRWLRFRVWLKEPKGTEVRQHVKRPLALALLGPAIPALTIFVLWIFLPEQVAGVGRAFDRLLTGPDAPALQWREAAQLLLLLVGLPSAFMLWWFRDIHVNRTLENQRKDVNLKEFQEIQARAAGALDDKLPQRARETMQIAAVHQLSGFLAGEYGASFQRPAWELLRANLIASSERIGTRHIADQIAAWHRNEGSLSGTPAQDLRASVQEALHNLNDDRVGDAERALIHDAWPRIFTKTRRLSQTCFDRIVLPRGALLASRDLSRCSFIGANLRRAHLEGADLGWAHLEGANLAWAHLKSADLYEAHLEGADLGWAHLEVANLCGAHLEGANLRRAHLEGANLAWAHLEGADLGWAHLEGANLIGAHLEGANLRRAHLEGAYFDANTALGKGWDRLDDWQRIAVWQKWTDAGAIMVNADGHPLPIG
ncbi:MULTISPECIES: pentapeptide repeat-containing protein [Pacificimonas]|nr:MULTISPECIES: pentapeptide repeat-containing protein [Pacificimonas]MBZ6379781.1 pentapeptide repeat-containing protein [Pacificimonas aurantium]